MPWVPHAQVEDDNKRCEEEQKGLLKANATGIDIKPDFLGIDVGGDSRYSANDLLNIST